MLFGLGQASWAQEVVEISTVEQLKEFRDAVNAGNQYAGKTVKLIADLDLSSESNWKPIGNLVSYPGQSFNGTFDGDGHIISNLTVNDNTPNYAVAGLFGSVVSGTVKNLTIKNVNLKSTHYAGAIVAYTSNNPTVENCHVIGGTITSTPELINGKYDNGDKVGGIFGYATTGSTIKNCSVEGVTIRGYRDIGGVAGFTGGSVTNCSVKDIILIQDNTNGYKEGDMSSTVGEVVGGRSANAVDVNKNNEKENVTIKRAGLGVAQIGDKLYKTLDEAVAAATEGQTILIIEAGDYKLPNLPKNVTIKGAADGIVSFTHTTENSSIASVPNGATFNNVTFNWGNVNYNGFQHAGTINMENCTLNGRLSSYGDMNFTDCKFVQDNSDYHMWAYSGNVTYKGCSFTNNKIGKFINVYNENGKTKYTVTVEDCTFINKAASNKAAINVKATCGSKLLNYDVIIKSCTTDGSFPAASITQKLAVINNLVQVDDRTADGKDSITVTLDNEQVYPIKDYVAQVGDKKYENLQDAFNAAEDGQTVTLLKDYDASAENDGNYNNTKRNLWLSKGITLDGCGHELTVTNRGIGVQGADGKIDVIFKDIAIKNSNKEGRCIDTRGKIGSLTIDNAVLSTESKEASQPLTIGGDQKDTATVKILNGSKVITSDDGKYGYAITTFNPVNMTIDGSTIKGWACLNIKAASGSAGSNGSVFNITNSELTSKNVYSGSSNAYSVFKIEDVDVTVNVTNTTINVDGDSNTEAIVAFAPNNTNGSIVNLGEGNNVTFTKTTDFALNGNAVSKLVISGGKFNQPVPEENCAEGFIPADLGDGWYSVKKGSYVASIGDKKYESLQEAVNVAADGDTITLLADVKESVEVKEGRKFVLDLNGKILDGYLDQYDSEILVKNGTISGTVWVNGGAEGTDSYNKFTLDATATIISNNGIVLYQADKTSVAYGSAIDINGTVTGNVWVMGNIHEGNSVINVNSGSSINGTVGIALNGNATLNIKEGSVIEGSEVGVEVRAGKLNVEGGKISSTAETYSFEPNNSGTTTLGAAIAVAQHNTKLAADVLISGGEFMGVKTISVVDAQGNGLEGVSVTATDSLLTEAVEIPEGFKWVSNGDGTSTLKPCEYVASIGDKKYESLQEAVDAAADGEIVKLLKDINLNSEFVNIDKTVTINGDGHTITSDAAQAILLKGSGDVTLSNTKVVASKGHGIQVGDDDAYSGKLVLNENSILTVAKRGIRVFKEDTGFGITIDNSTIQSSKKDPKTTYTTGNDAIGLSLAATDGKGYDVNINNTIIQGFSYDINGTTSGSNLNVTMTGGATYGRAVLNVWGSNNNFTLNGVDVHGLNNQTGSTEAFSCIVENENAHDNQYTIKDCPFTATLSEAAMTAEGSTASEQMIGLRGANSTVKVLGSTTYICNSDERGGFIYSEIALMNNKLYFDDTTKATFANAFEEAVISDEKDAEVGLYPVNYIPEVYYYWIDEGSQNGVYCKLAEPFAKGWLSDGEFIALQKDVKLTDNIVCKLGEDTSFTILLGDHKLTKESYSIVINKGVTVKTDKSAKVFSSSVDGYIVKETKIEDGYSYSLEEASVMYTDAKGKVTYYATVPNILSAGVYKLLKDVTVDKRMAPAVLASDVTIDLNGYTLTSNATDCGFLLTRSQHKFSIVDNSENGGGHLITKEDAIMINGKGYDVSIGKGVIIDGCISMFKSDNTLNVEGTINGGDYFAIVTNGNQTTSGTINIKEGAALTSNTIAMYLPGKADVNIEGGDISGSTGIYMKSGKLNVTGGNITGNGEKKDYQYYGNGAYSTGNALAIDNCGYPGGIPDVNISGGTFTSKNNDAIGSYAYGDERESVKKFISGGYFSNEVSQELCAEGYVSVKADDKEGYFTVVTKEDAGIFELNDNDTEYPYCEGRAATKISYKRTFMQRHVDKYQAWFVPFDYTITNEDEDNFQFYKIHLIAASAEVEVHDNTKVYVYIEPIGEGTVLKGNRPYVVKPKKELIDYVFVAENINKLYSEDSSSRLHQETTEFEYDFYGTFRKEKFIEENQVLYLDGGNIVWNSSDNTVRTYRWYIKTTSKDNDNYAKPDIIFIEEGNEPTGIEINDTIGDGIIGIYTSNGIKVDNPVKGINIIRYADGKTRKIYVK